MAQCGQQACVKESRELNNRANKAMSPSSNTIQACCNPQAIEMLQERANGEETDACSACQQKSREAHTQSVPQSDTREQTFRRKNMLTHRVVDGHEFVRGGLHEFAIDEELRGVGGRRPRKAGKPNHHSCLEHACRTKWRRTKQLSSQKKSASLMMKPAQPKVELLSSVPAWWVYAVLGSQKTLVLRIENNLPGAAAAQA